jgi:L-asparaginase/Glu-tRNA(Gln) amidotransferase subunit D
MKIMLAMTGGTICSYRNIEGQFSSDTDKAAPMLTEGYEDSGIEFDVRPVLNVLSENMTFSRLGALLSFFKNLTDEEIDECSGIIIAHGTDTLAYSASLLAIALAGFKKPVMLVSSNFVLDREGANGRINFRAAVDLLSKGFGAGVYVPYLNSDGIVYLHRGAHLEQCRNFSNDFFSFDMMPVDKAKAYAAAVKTPLVKEISTLNACVMKIEPYVGLDYSLIRPSGEVRAILHGSYHSATACVERASREEAFTRYSALYLLKYCKEHSIDFWLNGFNVNDDPLHNVYTTTADLILNGAKPIYGLTNETAYMKLSLAYSLGYSGDKAAEFMESELAAEKIRN